VPLSADWCRDARPFGAIEALARDIHADIRFAVRQFRRRPLSALTMTAVLALGIGFSSAIVVSLRSLLASPPAGVPAERSLVRIRGIDASRGPGRTIGREFSYPEYRAYASQSEVFSAVAAWTSIDVTLDTGATTPNLLSGAATFVTAGYFPVLGVQLDRGAGLPADAADAGGPVLAGVISDVLWQRYFASAPDIAGRTLKVNGVPVTIAGVAPPRFVGARTGGSAMRVWLPLNAQHVVRRDGQPADSAREAARFGVVARLQSGVDPAQAALAVRTIAARLHQSDTAPSRPGFSADVVPVLAENYFPPSGDTPGTAGRIATLLMPTIVLLITCTNVSTMLAGIALSRRREIAVRLSVGASRARVVRQLVTESVVLAVAGGLLGLFVIWLSISLSDATFLSAPLAIDWRAGAFTLVVSIATGVAFGLSPALHATRAALSCVLQESDVTVTRSRLQSGLVIAQIALTQPTLLSMGALFLELRADLRDERPGTTVADRILDVRFNTNPRYGALDDRREDAVRRVRDGLLALPGVRAVVAQALAADTVLVAADPSDQPAAQASAPLEVDVHGAPPGYFDLMGLSLAAGRDFSITDDRTSGSVVLTAALAHRLWGTDDVVGRVVISDTPVRARSGIFTVIGVVSDPARAGARREDYRLFMSHVGVTSHLLVRTAGPAEAVLPLVRVAAQAAAPELPIVSARTLASMDAEARSSTMRGMLAAGGSGALALLLAAIGLYSVVTVAVSQRVREIGIRASLGADKGHVVRLFVRKGLAAAVVGLSIGLALSVAAIRALAAAEGNEPPAGLLKLSVMVALFVMIVAWLAAWIPARRAARLDPLRALRME
jgi:predicted permease